MDNNFRKIFHIPAIHQFKSPYFPYGLDGLLDVFPMYITYLAKTSGTLMNCIIKKSTFLVGNGFDDNFEKQVINQKGETIAKLLKLSARDVIQYGGFAWLISYNAFGEVCEVNKLPFELVRVKETETPYSNPTEYALLPYEKYRTRKGNYNAEFFKVFNPNDVEKGICKETGKPLAKSQILYCPIDLMPGNDFYPFPCYLGVMQDIESEINLSIVRNIAISEGFKGQTVVTIYGTNAPSNEQKERDLANYKNVTGVTGKNTIINWALSQDSKPTIESVPIVDLSRTWEVSEKMVQTKIMKSFDTPEEFFSFTGKSDFLGDADKMTKLLEFYQKTALNDYQKQISIEFEKVFKHWYNKAILPSEFKIENLSLNDLALNSEVDNNDNTSKITATNPEQAKAQAGLRGSVGGVTGILQIQASVTSGATQYDSAITILKEIYGFTDIIAKKILGNPKKDGTISNPAGF